MKLPNTFMDGIVNILNKVQFPNPCERQRAYISMRHISEQTIKTAKAKTVHELLRDLNNENLTLRPVKAMCNRLYSGASENMRRFMMERMVMRWKLDDASKQREKSRRKLAYMWWSSNDDIKVLKKYRILTLFKKLTTSESEREVNKQRRMKHNKVKFLKEKKKEDRREGKKNKRTRETRIVNDCCRSINTSDRPLPPEFNREPRVYGDARVSEEELSALRLPPKFTTYEKVNKQQCFVEIETMMSKYLWELRKEHDCDTNENKTDHEVSDDLVNTTLNNPKETSDENVCKLRQCTTSERVKEKEDPGLSAINPVDRQKKTKTPSVSNAKTVSNINPNDNDKSINPIIDTEPVASRTRSHSQAKIKESSSTEKTSLNNKSKSNDRSTPNTTDTDPSNPPPNQHINKSKPAGINEERRYHFDIDSEKFDFRNLRPTDLPFNKHIYLPQNDKNRPENEEEIELAFLGLQLQKATEEVASNLKLDSNLNKKRN